jgi:FkbM family methyltransferase
MNNYEKCFDQHSLQELNNLDTDKFVHILNLFQGKFTVSDNSIFFDVGCNAGSFVKILKSKFGDKMIHCFEPHPVLSKVVKGLYSDIKMNEICVSNYNGDIIIYVPTLSVGISSIIRRPVFDKLNQEIMVLNTKCTTLDTYCELNNINEIDFIKIDVEGAEKVVFEGAKSLLSSKKIKAGMFEVGQTLLDAGTSTEEVCQLIESFGYTIEKVYESDYFFYLQQ